MTVTITALDDNATTTPLAILSPYSLVLQGRNVVHDLIGGGVAVSFQTTRDRGGTITYLYEDEAEAWHGATLHKRATRFRLIDTDSSSNFSMSYVVDGAVTLSLDPDTMTHWKLTVDYLVA